jgi:hypothetical protein
MSSPPSGDRDEHEPTIRPERVERDTEPTTPRSGLPASDELIDSRTEPRIQPTPVVRLRDDTLMSAPAPADAEEATPEPPRVNELERRLQQLEARLAVLEVTRGNVSKLGNRWLAWIAFLLTLAVAWQLVERLR